MGHNDRAGREPDRNVDLADRYERERAGVSGDPSPNRTKGGQKDKSSGQSADRWREKLKHTIAATVYRERGADAATISSKLLLNDLYYMGVGGRKERFPPEVIDHYAEEVDCLKKSGNGEWVIDR